MFIEQALRWNIYGATILLIAVAAIFTITGKPRPYDIRYTCMSNNNNK